jgi:hypothetical protein
MSAASSGLDGRVWAATGGRKDTKASAMGTADPSQERALLMFDLRHAIGLI